MPLPNALLYYHLHDGGYLITGKRVHRLKKLTRKIVIGLPA